MHGTEETKATADRGLSLLPMDMAAGPLVAQRRRHERNWLGVLGDMGHRMITAVLGVLCASVVSNLHAAGVAFMQSSFTGGELSPLATARIDAERYYTSATTMENMRSAPERLKTGAMLLPRR